ncbi:MAG: AAA family ATPase [Hahellaceae bacterium]|nr:AAA family ATPase [Hahellaceae bacterium]MCP5212175.1 AAA family ATPase [Hahellaceae bacterium]
MYLEYFALNEFPFSIAPDPKYLFLSERHKEALAHLLYGVRGQGGFILLTGEVGTGKTTVCRSFLEQLPEATDVAYIVNPKLSARELLAAICDELKIDDKVLKNLCTVKNYTDAINQYLLSAHAKGRHTVLIIDEAQNLSVDVLEQIRLLTNLETSEKKLLQIVLLGQPELKELVAKPVLRQLSQRITARYHLGPLERSEVKAYIRLRLNVAGRLAPLFSDAAIQKVYKLSRGIPRLINLICDRSLLAAYAGEYSEVTPALVKSAAKEAMGEVSVQQRLSLPPWVTSGLLLGVAAGITTVVIAMALKGLYTPGESLVPVDGSQANVTVKGEVLRQSVAENTPSTLVQVKRDSVEAPTQILLPANDTSSPFASILTASSLPEDLHSSLLNRWHIEATPAQLSSKKAFCNLASTNGLQCNEMIGSWRQVVDIDHPVILSLRLPEYGQRDVLLLSIHGETAELAGPLESVSVPVKSLQDLWYGEFRFIWKVPPYRSERIVPGQVVDKDKWVIGAMDVIRDYYKSNHASVYAKWPHKDNLVNRDNIKEQVRFFQAAHGLTADGIVGEMTELQMSHYVYNSLPRLNLQADLSSHDR